MLCPVCQGETIYDSPSKYADDMGAILIEQINEGLTDDQIYTFWVSRYGERIITNPINRNLEILFIPLTLVFGFVLDSFFMFVGAFLVPARSLSRPLTWGCD